MLLSVRRGGGDPVDAEATWQDAGASWRDHNPMNLAPCCTVVAADAVGDLFVIRKIVVDIEVGLNVIEVWPLGAGQTVQPAVADRGWHTSSAPGSGDVASTCQCTLGCHRQWRPW